MRRTISSLETIAIKIDRHKLARKRWRHAAEDGTDFGIDVEEALSHGDVIHLTDTKAYIIEQEPENCFQIALPEPAKAAWTGWMIGNLHFKAAFTDDSILVPDDLAVEQMLEREQLRDHIVVVTRWYGGKHLGGDRFKHVKHAMRHYFDHAKPK